MNVIDTSVLIDVLRGTHKAVVALREARSLAPLHSSVVVRAEVLAGMRATETHGTLTLLDSVQWHDVTVDISDEAGRLGRRWLPSHSGIDTADLLIAATATLLGGNVMTMNVRHYPMFDNLTPPY